jgi:putative membrane protein
MIALACLFPLILPAPALAHAGHVHARRPVYPLQSDIATASGLTPLEDQQLAGLIMWVPAGTVYAVAALVLAGIWIGGVGIWAGRSGDAAIG